MDRELACNILDILETMQEAVKQMKAAYEAGNISEFDMLSADIKAGLAAVRDIAAQAPEEDRVYRLRDGCICALTALEEIRLLISRKPEEVPWKLECELLAFLEGTYLKFFYYKIMRDDPERKRELHVRLTKTGGFCRLPQEEKDRVYSCDLSIYMPAYNHLDYSRLCVESILRNMPKDITCELVLLNHGSTDGTREYFESIPGAHVINLKMNRLLQFPEKRALTGKYSLYVSNDIVIGKNAIDNMYRAISEHEDYGWVVPSTSAVSNFQTIPVDYNSMEEFHAFAARNNIYDERRHEVRVRLCNPVTMIRTDLYSQLVFDLYEQMFCVQNASSFPDDKISLWIRRNGYKSILAKDAYCHHFGSVTHKNDFGTQKKRQEFHDQGREAFLMDFGVDPWGTGFCYDDKLFKDWKLKPKDHISVLGINCGFGSNSLKVKETLRELGAKDVTLYNAVQEEQYLEDLNGVSDHVVLFKNMSDIPEKTGQYQYEYILIDDAISGCAYTDYVRVIKAAGITFGELAFKNQDENWEFVHD